MRCVATLVDHSAKTFRLLRVGGADARLLRVRWQHVCKASFSRATKLTTIDTHVLVCGVCVSAGRSALLSTVFGIAPSVCRVLETYTSTMDRAPTYARTILLFPVRRPNAVLGQLPRAFRKVERPERASGAVGTECSGSLPHSSSCS